MRLCGEMDDVKVRTIMRTKLEMRIVMEMGGVGKREAK